MNADYIIAHDRVIRAQSQLSDLVTFTSSPSSGQTNVVTDINVKAHIATCTDQRGMNLQQTYDVSTSQAERVDCRPRITVFRLLDLPAEIQRLIYAQYYGSWEVTLEYERLTMLRSRFHMTGVPPIDLLLTAHVVSDVARPMRWQCFSGRLILNSVFILVPLRRQERFAWLRDNVRTLHFSDSSVHPERWNRYYDSFVNLKRLEIEFPRIIELECATLTDLMQGRQDEILVESLDTFRLALVEQSQAGTMEVVVGQRYTCRPGVLNRWSGILVSGHRSRCYIRLTIDQSMLRYVSITAAPKLSNEHMRLRTVSKLSSSDGGLQNCEDPHFYELEH